VTSPVQPFDRIRLATVTSTQDEARALARGGAASGVIVIADEQTAGRGRGDRTWASAAVLGLWFTLVHRSARPVREWPALTGAAALAVCRAIEDAGLFPGIRWPNDVVIGRRKICGVLAETEGGAALIGIGLNVRHRETDFPLEIRPHATSIAIEMRRDGCDPPEREPFMDALLRRLDETLRDFEAAGPRAIVPAVWERSIVRGRRVRIGADTTVSDARIMSGEAIGLGENGELRIRTTGGAIVEMSSGSFLGMEEL